MQKGGEGVQIACKFAYVLNGRPAKGQLVREYQGEPRDYNFDKYVYLRLMLLSIKFSIKTAVYVLPFQPTEWPRDQKYRE